MATKRFHQPDDSELEELLKNKDSKNTKKSTAVAVNCFKEFLKESGRANTNFHEYETAELDECLRCFYAGARKTDGTLFKKSALQNIKYGLKRHLSETKKVDINKDVEFTKSNTVFQAMCVDLKRKGLGKIEHYPEITDEDLQTLYSNSSPVFDTETPCGLQFKVWFEIMLFLCRRGQENLRTMTKETFCVKTDASGHKYVYQHIDEMDKNHRDTTNPLDAVTEGRMYERKGDPLCPVASFVKYISKLSDRAELWQRPKESFNANDSTWYCNSPLGKNTLANLMSEISRIANLSTIYTNHSVRATSITVMDTGGITGRHIMKVSGHRSETSIKNYSRRVSDQKKREISSVLSNAIAVNTNHTSNIPVTTNAHTEYTNNVSTIKPVDNNVNEEQLPPELYDLFSNEMELEEINGGNMENDPQINNIANITNGNKNVNTIDYTSKAKGVCSFMPKFQNCSVNFTINFHGK